MTETPIRKWIPANLLDEIPPAMLASPQDWLQPMPNGTGFTLKSAFHDDEEQEAACGWKFVALTCGQRVDFVWFEDYGQVDVVVRKDGTFDILDSVDPRADYFSVHLTDIVGGSIADVVKELIDTDGLEEDVERVAISTYHYSDPVAFSFDIVDGNPCFTEAGTA